MAIGDAAVAAGMDIVPGTTLANTIDTEINKTRDYIANFDAATQSVAKGGTGATTAAAARTNLGLAAMAQGIVASTIVQRDASGGLSGQTLWSEAQGTNPKHVAQKGYVDGALSSKVSHGADATLGHIYTPAGRATPVVTSYVAAYINSDGRIGATPSAERFKQDIKPRQYTLDQLRAMQTVIYRIRTAVEFLGDKAPFEVGVIAEHLIEIGLPEFVVFDAEGNTQSVAYERLVLVVIGAVQQLADRVDDIEARLDALEEAAK